jgi:hypothetical protein
MSHLVAGIELDGSFDEVRVRSARAAASPNASAAPASSR